MKKLFLLLIFSIITLSIFSQTDKNESESRFFGGVSEIMPQFPGGEAEMYKFIEERLFYPWEGDTIKGRVIMRFVVDTLGDLRRVEVLRGIHPMADSMAVNIVRDMPRWSIGKQNGRPVNIYFTLPVKFNPVDIEADKKLNTTSCMMPTFRGGDEAIYKFIAKNLKYPSICADVQGKVVVQFIIDSNGKVWHPYIQKSLDPVFDAEALRVVRLMPNWIVPKGSVGCYLFTMPIIFRSD